MATRSQADGPGPITVPTRYLTDAVSTASKTFAKDVARPRQKMPVNSIFEPVLYQLFLRDQRGEKINAPAS